MAENRPPITSRQQTLQQQRANHAWKAICEVENSPSQCRKEYGSLVRGLPAMIQRDGLGPVLAFLNAKAKDVKVSAHRLAFTHVGTWVYAHLTGNREKQAPDVMQWLMELDSVAYRRATSEAQAYLLWLKRFAEAKGWSDENAVQS